MSEPASVPQLLRAIQGGDPEAGSQLFTLLYEELRSRARNLALGDQKQVTLQATALVHEAYLRLLGAPGVEFVDQHHFLACASRAMRHILIDHARRTRPVTAPDQTLDTIVAAFEERVHDMERFDRALRELERLDPEMVSGIEMRFFGNASESAAAQALGIPLRSFQRRWKAAKAMIRKTCDES